MGDDRTEPADALRIRDRIERGLEELQGVVDSRAVEQLTRLVVLLAQWASRMNLTGHRDPLDMTSRLVLDAAALARALPELDAALRLADLGSGAGFPGLPIAILHPHLAVQLVESRQKRHHFQREARRQLDLRNVTPILGRADEVEVSPCEVVVAQAMTLPDQAIASMQRWLRAGGILVLPASERAERPEAMLELELAFERRSYRVPFAGITRQLWIARPPAT